MRALLFGFLLLPLFTSIGQVQAAQLMRGPADAKVKMLIYGDYECPFTVRMMGLLGPLTTEFGDDLAIIYAQYPLDFHPHAEVAAIAGICAGDQGRLDQYSQKLFEKSRDLTPEYIRESARDAGVKDMMAFDACRKNEVTKIRMQSDIMTANAIGVVGTPSIHINGQLIAGAYPIEEFQKIIREKLAK